MDSSEQNMLLVSGVSSALIGLIGTSAVLNVTRNPIDLTPFSSPPLTLQKEKKSLLFPFLSGLGVFGGLSAVHLSGRLWNRVANKRSLTMGVLIPGTLLLMTTPFLLLHPISGGETPLPQPTPPPQIVIDESTKSFPERLQDNINRIGHTAPGLLVASGLGVLSTSLLLKPVSRIMMERIA